jgi:Flp pilus assembly protein TadD
MTQALKVLDRGAQPDGAGDHATLRLIRARLLVGLARGREAQAALVGNMDNLPKDQRATLLEALGRLRVTQGDVEGAREAFMAWAKLLPASKQPLLTLLQLSLETSDETAAQGYLAEIEKLDRSSVSSSVLGVQPQAGRADSLTLLARARVDYYFSDPGSAARGKQQDAQDAERLRRAEAAIKPLVDKKSPDPAVLLLYGQIQERKGSLDGAIESYRRAWELGNEASLPPLLNLLVRQERYDEIQSISKPESGLNVRRLSAQALLGFGSRQGNRGDLLDELKNDPARNEIWNTRMRELAGEIDEVENILRAQAREKAEPSLQIRRWLALIESQARHNRSAQVIEESIRELLKTKTRLPDLLEAQARWTAGQLGEAEKIYGEVVRQRADDPVALAAVAQHYEATGRPDQAIATYNQAYQLNKANRPVARQLAIAVSA